MQLLQFETMLVEVLTRAGWQVQRFADAKIPLLYGVRLSGGRGSADVHLLRGSGTGDVQLTDDEKAVHEANVARLTAAGGPKPTPAVESPAIEVLRQILLDTPIPDATGVEPLASGKPGVKVRFQTGSEVYLQVIR